MLKKFFITIGIICVLCLVSVSLYLMLKERNVIVLAYHKVVPKEIKEKYYKDDPWIDTTERFEKQMKFLYDHNYESLSMDEYEKWRNKKRDISLKTVMITIDDGDIETYYEIMPILKKYNLKGTYFAIGESIKDSSEKYDPSRKQFLNKELIEKIKQEYPNLEIQSHSYGMHNRNNNVPYVFDMSKEEIEKDFDNMKEIDDEIDVYCYPYGLHTDTILEVLEEKKYRMAFKLDKSGISKISDNKYLIPRVGVNYDTSFANFKKWLIKAIIL